MEISFEHDYKEGYWNYWVVTVTIINSVSQCYHAPLTLEQIEGAIGQALERARSPSSILEYAFEALHGLTPTVRPDTIRPPTEEEVLADEARENRIAAGIDERE